MWQINNEFDNLTENTEYTFYQRSAETDDTYASKSSEGTVIKTERIIKTTIATTEYNKTNNSCTINYEITDVDLSKSPIIYIAFYTDKKELVKVSAIDQNMKNHDEFSVPVPAGSNDCKVFILESNLIPLCKSDKCTIQ